MDIVVVVLLMGIAALCVLAVVRGRRQTRTGDQPGPGPSAPRPPEGVPGPGPVTTRGPSSDPSGSTAGAWPSSPAPTRPPQHRRLVPGGSVEVVGESHYQPALRAAARGRAAAGWDDGIVVEAALIPDPANPYDSNAVRIEVDGRLVGHLSRAVAPPYQRALLSVPGGGAWGTCSARILGGGQRSYGIWLHLAPAEMAVPVNALRGREVVDGSRRVTVTGEEAHQQQLAAVVGDHTPAAVWATLVPGTVGKGKYAGQPCIDVHIDGERVGCLTKAMSDRHAHLLAAGPITCTGVVDVDPRGLQVEVLLP